MRFPSLLVFVFAVLAACDSIPDPLPVPVDRRGTIDLGFPTTGDEPLQLDRAIMEDNPEQLGRLLEAGADPNVRWGPHGDRFPLQEAIEPDVYHRIRHHRNEMVGLLLKHRADPNARWCPFESRNSAPGWISCNSKQGYTPLIRASLLDQADTTYLLLDAGADPALKDLSDANALDYARSEPIFFLLQAAMFPDAASRNASTPNYLRQRADSSDSKQPRDETPLARASAGAIAVSTLDPPPPPGAGTPTVFGDCCPRPVDSWAGR